MKYFWRNLLIFTVILYLGYVLVFALFHHQFKNLSRKDDIKPSKCIMVYNPGQDIDVLKNAQQLLDKYSDSKLIYSPFVVNNEDNSLQLIRKVGIDKSKVLPEYYSTSMKDSANYVSKIMHKENLKNCIIVARDYEMNRLITTFEKYNPLFDFYNKSVKLNGKSYLETSEGRKLAEHELWQYPKLWINQ